jgi:glycosyltransferase-like protein
MTAPLRIALLTHSTNPRGGVVHALELGDALTRLGHDVTAHAPDPSGSGFFRPTLCHTMPIAATSAGRDVTAMVEVRVADYSRHFEREANRRFDIWHAQDGISANALATLKERGLIGGFARTVHHVDHFADPRLSALQLRAIAAADCLFAVSRVWRDWLARRFDRAVTNVGNGVDIDRFSPVADANDEELRAMLGIAVDNLARGYGPTFLAVGGVEERKNTLRILQAFARVHANVSSARLVIAGGASLLDHDAYQAEFSRALASSGLPAHAVIRTGPIADALMPALYRAANALVFPSVKEGFGLVVLEAMASGIPVVTSRIAPFTEYLSNDDVLWCEPDSVESIAAAMTASLDRSRRAALINRGLRLAARHGWRSVAQAHLPAYAGLREPAHA